MSALKSKFSFEDVDLFLTQQDTLSALIVWLVLEGLSFILLPSFQLIPGEHKHLTWILISGSLGVTGAVLIGLSSGIIQYCHDNLPRRGTNKQSLINVAQVMSWMGLAGVGFPLVFVALEFWVILTQGTLD
ncbi:hypothetical protein C1752_00851 [Acaryochloris thomasi RCC1774]|uniref:Uncharacterized protein n=1 Tax=Acaryochloris thomasi RCC1774 TaxID=1764569 RepID=A0A2W1JWY4_9CYAN|nr:hypothetical protein [Acaryochloris thomasi]PZD74875.1 hypothetical protein C1752_00851 [Acaryochloris thomasi RCC1774]